ncbi:MAG: hypothetical protein Q8Q02_06080 [Nocardioides sp.]|nr:hypothetical protein [Nocardioides sp.]
MADTLTAVADCLASVAPISIDVADEGCANKHTPVRIAILSAIAQQSAAAGRRPTDDECG